MKTETNIKLIVLLIVLSVSNALAEEFNTSSNITSNTSITYVSWIPGSIQDISMGNSQGFPSLNNLTDGKKIITFKYPTDGDLQGMRGQIYMRILDNDTLSKPVLLFGDGGQHNYDAAEIIIMPNNDTWTISSKIPDKKLVYKMCLAELDCSHISNWSAESDMPNVVPQNGVYGGYPYALDEHFKSYNGTVYLPIYVWDNSSNTQHIKAGVLITSNNGSSWNFSFFDPLGWDGVAGSEGSIVWTEGSHMIAIWRAILPSFKQIVWMSESHDMGLTWKNVTDIGKANGGIFPWLADVELTTFDNTIVLTAIDSTDGINQGLSAWVRLNNSTWGQKNALIIEARGEIGYHGIEYVGNNEAYIVYNSGGSSFSASINIGKINITNTIHSPITVKSTFSSDSGSGYHSITSGGGGGVSASSENYSNVLKYEQHSRNLVHGKFVSYNFSLPIYQVLLEGKENELDVSVRVEMLKGAPNGTIKLDGEVVQYFNVIKSSRRINESIIRFKVNGSNVPVELYAWNKSEWNKLEVTDDIDVLNSLSKGTDDNSTYYTYQILEPQSTMNFAIVKIKEQLQEPIIVHSSNDTMIVQPTIIYTPIATVIAEPTATTEPRIEVIILASALLSIIGLAILIFHK